MQQTSPTTIQDVETEYQAIERALLERARGRWFLAEHGRRARRLDSMALEDAIGRLQHSLREPPALLSRLKAEVGLLSEAVDAIRKDVLARESAHAPASGQGAPMPQQILTAAEDMHEIAWDLQAQEMNPDNCQDIARHAARIYALSHAQATTARRALATANALDQLSARLAAIRESIEHELQADAPAAAKPAENA
jgi:hypothetical protein